MNGRLLHVGQLSSRDHMSHMCAATKGSFVFNTNIYDKLWIPFVLELAKLSVTFSSCPHHYFLRVSLIYYMCVIFLCTYYQKLEKLLLNLTVLN